MPSSGTGAVGRPRRSDVRATRLRILEAARTEFSLRGFEAATLQGVAERVGITRPSINYHFFSKDGLYREVIKQTDAMLTALIASINVPPPGATVLDELHELYTVLAVHPENAAVAASWVSATWDAHRQPELPGPDETIIATHLDAILRRAIEHGELDEAEDVTSTKSMLVALLWGVVTYTTHAPTSPSTDAVSILLPGLLAGLPWGRE